jgi:hypothetical protein
MLLSLDSVVRSRRSGGVRSVWDACGGADRPRDNNTPVSHGACPFMPIAGRLSWGQVTVRTTMDGCRQLRGAVPRSQRYGDDLRRHTTPQR